MACHQTQLVCSGHIRRVHDPLVCAETDLWTELVQRTVINIPVYWADGGFRWMLFDCQGHAEDTCGQEACTEMRNIR